MKSLILLMLVLLLTFEGQSQTDHSSHNCISLEFRIQVFENIKLNKKNNSITVKKSKKVPNTFLKWPLRQSKNYDYPGYYHITQYMANVSKEGVTDYKCGSRTSNGHRGMDIAPWPYEWNMMQLNQIEVIAAADGIIVDKMDGHADQHCAKDPTNQANYIILQHENGHYTFYWHLKNGSLSKKAIGETVAQGEFLASIGSSGMSESPHLHFEVTDAKMNPIDPYACECKKKQRASLWADEKPYYQPKINYVQLSKKTVDFGECGQLAKTNQSYAFVGGEEILIYAFYQDMVKNVTQNYTITKPDGTVWEEWTNTEDDYTSNYLHHKILTLPQDAITGKWNLEVSFMWQTINYAFDVSTFNPTTSNIESTNGSQK